MSHEDVVALHPQIREFVQRPVVEAVRVSEENFNGVYLWITACGWKASDANLHTIRWGRSDDETPTQQVRLGDWVIRERYAGLERFCGMTDREFRLQHEPLREPSSGPCVFDGVHCFHWSYTPDPCCFCGSETDSDDGRCPGNPWSES